MPDNGLSHRDYQPGDEIHPRRPELNDEPNGLEGIEYPETPYEEPLDIEEFKDKIDTRGGYFYGILQSELENSAKSTDDFTEELNPATKQTLAERQYAKRKVIKHYMHQGKSKKQAGKLAVQLVQSLHMPEPENSPLKKEKLPYREDHRPATGKAQDKRLPLIKKWLSNGMR